MLQDATEVRAPRGQEMSCKGWHQEAALRMLMNNLDPALRVIGNAFMRLFARCEGSKTMKHFWSSRGNPSEFSALTPRRREC